MTIRLVIFDWAGTTVDHGCFAPVVPFVEAFARHGVTITTAQAREPMGLGKKDHLRELFRLPDVAAAWKKVRGRDWTEADVEDLYRHHFLPLQVEAAPRHARLVPGLLDCVAELTRRGIKLGTTTGYFREAAELVAAAARSQGYVPDHMVVPDEVPAGRPLPWMIFRNMEALSVYPPSAVVKVGDTLHDIAEGRNAGVRSVGVIQSSSDVGLSEEELATTPAAQLESLKSRVRRRMLAAGASAVINTLAELPALLETFTKPARG